MSSVALVSGVLATCNRIAVRALIAGASHGRNAATAVLEDDLIHDTTAQQKRALTAVATTMPLDPSSTRVKNNRTTAPKKIIKNDVPLSAYSIEPCTRKFGTTALADDDLAKSDDQNQTDPQKQSSKKATLTRRSSIATQSGCAKDMMNGPSTVHMQDRYGDDACFIEKHEVADVFGVADGVGGWRVYGLDPGTFSRALMSNCASVVASGAFEPNRPDEILARAYEMLRKDNTPKKTTRESRRKKALDDDEEIVCGSSTACVVVLDKLNSQVHTANLGDSGYLVIRDGKVVERSREQCHYFNAPYQIAHIPADGIANYFSDSVDSAETTAFDVEPGDVILLATDGLFDNVPSSFIEAEMEAHNVHQMTDVNKLQMVCNALTLVARRLSMDAKHDSPFAQKAREEGHRGAIGGKPDDITVLLILVVNENQKEQPKTK